MAKGWRGVPYQEPLITANCFQHPMGIRGWQPLIPTFELIFAAKSILLQSLRSYSM